MKKLIALIMTVSLLFSMAAFGGSASAVGDCPEAGTIADGNKFGVTIGEFYDLVEQVLTDEDSPVYVDGDVFFSDSETNPGLKNLVIDPGSGTLVFSATNKESDTFPGEDETFNTILVLAPSDGRDNEISFETLAKACLYLTFEELDTDEALEDALERVRDEVDDEEWLEMGPFKVLCGLFPGSINTFGIQINENYTPEEPEAKEAKADTKTYSTTYETLEQGSTGSEVVALQKRLIELKYLSGSADGSYGQMTATAIVAFQYAVGLPRTGIADNATQNELFADTAPIKSESNTYYAVQKISVAQSKYVLFEGDSTKPKFTISPDNATDKSLKYSSDSSVVKVDKDGTITANGSGKAKVTVEAADGSGVKTSFTVVCEPACPVTLTGLGTGTYQANLLSLTFKSLCNETAIRDIYFDVTLKAYNGDTISSGSYHTETIYLGPGSTYVKKANLSGVGYTSQFIIRITGVELNDGTVYDIPYYDQEVTSWG